MCMGSIARAETRSDRATKDVSRWLKSRVLKGLEVGVSVRDLGTGQVLVSHRADRVMYPASVAKVLTTVAALKLVSPQTRFRTVVRGNLGANGQVEGLTLVGSGDSQLIYKDIAKLAKALHSRGVRSVTGGIRIDVTRYDRKDIPPAFTQKNTASGYRASIGAAGSEYGALTVIVTPSARTGAPVKARLARGSSGVILRNRASTKDGKKDSLIWYTDRARDSGRSIITVRGTLGKGNRRVVKRVRVVDPNRYTGYLLKDALKRLRIKVRGAIEVGAGTKHPVLAEHKSASLRRHLRAINVYSNNYMAETVFKNLSITPQVTVANWPGAQARVTESLLSAGLKASTFRIVNGSGLYKATRISPAAMTDLLVTALKNPRTKGLKALLPASGAEGSLKKRLGGRMRGKVRAKTGTLDDVVTLAGYLDGRYTKLAFAIFINKANAKLTVRLRQSIDRLVRRLSRLK